MNPPSASLTAFKASRSGEGLIETALIVPFLLTMILNAVNFGYFFLVALNLTAAPRSAVFLGCQKAQALGAKLDDDRLPLLMASDKGLSVLVESMGQHSVTLDPS